MSGSAASSPSSPVSPSPQSSQAPAGAVARKGETPEALVARVNGDLTWGDTYYQQITNPAAWDSKAAKTQDTGGKTHDYYGGKNAPRVDQLKPGMQVQIQQNYGVAVNEDEAKSLIQRGWTYGAPAPDGFEYDRDTGLLKKSRSALKTAVKVAAIAAPISATVATGGAASPWLYATIGGLAGAAPGIVDGDWREALIGGAGGFATGGLVGSTGNIASQTAKQIGVHAAEGAGISAATTAARGGGVGDVLKSGAIGAAGAAAPGIAKNIGTSVGANVAGQTAISAGTGAAAGALNGRQGLVLGAIGGGAGPALNNAAMGNNGAAAQAAALAAQRTPNIYRKAMGY